MKLNFLRLCALTALTAFSTPTVVSAQDTPANSEQATSLDVKADQMVMLPDDKGAVATGHVVITHLNALLQADKVTINGETGDFEAEGNVVLTSGMSRWSGQKVSGNFEKRLFNTENCEAQHGPWQISADKAGREIVDTETEEMASVIEGARCTTCDKLHDDGHPHYHISASKMVMHEDGSMTLHHPVMKVGNVPVFYLPRLYFNQANTGAFNFELGYRSKWGAFLLMERRQQIGEHWTQTWQAGYRTKNGPSLGSITEYRKKGNQATLELFGILDDDAPTIGDSNYPESVEGDYNKRFDSEEERYRVRFEQKLDITPNLTLRQHYDLLSDIDMLEDWYEREYDAIYQPKSEVSLDYYTLPYEVTLKARPRLNDFYSAVERLPELNLNVFRRQLGDSNFFYQSETSVAQLEMKWRETDLPRINGLADLEDYDTLRFDTLHSIYMPMHYDNWLTIVPRAGLRLTYYSDSSENGVSTGQILNNQSIADPDNISGRETAYNYDDMGGDLWRMTGELGLEMTFKKFRTWNDYRSESFDLDGLRHVVEPYMNVTSIMNPTEDKENIYFFDDVDRIDEMNFVRFGARQRFQTRRDREIYTFATLDNYADFHATTSDNYEHLGDFGTKATFRPQEDLSVYTRLLVGMDDANINEFQVGTILGDKKHYYTEISYLFRNDYDSMPAYSMNSYLDNFGSSSYLARDFEENHIANLVFGFPINEKTRGEVTVRYDIERGKLVENMYEVQRDLHCWKGALRLGMDDEEFKVMVLLYLKDVPGFKVRTSM